MFSTNVVISLIGWVLAISQLNSVICIFTHSKNLVLNIICIQKVKLQYDQYRKDIDKKIKH